jgi:hypothetical protein
VNSQLRARIPAIGGAVLLLAWCAFVFRGTWIDLARADHLALLEERLLFPTRAAYAWHLLGYQRTRILSGEDLVLSRPLFDAYHALLEGVLEVDGLERGLLGIAVHALTVVAVYSFARRWLPLGLAVLAGLAVASPLPGVDLVVWRHVTPYGLAVCFLALAAAEWSAPSPSSARSAVFLTLSALAHEAMIAVLVVAALAARERRAFAPLAICAGVYAAVALAFPAAEAPSASGASVAGLAHLPRVLGLGLVAWAAPWTFPVALDPWSRAVVSPPGVPDALVLGVGGVALAAALVGSVLGVLAYRRAPRPELAVALLVGGYLLAGTALLSFGRLGTRGPAYLEHSGYYFQIWAVCLEMLAVLAVGARLRAGPAPIAVGALCAAAVSSIAAVAIVGPLALGQRTFARQVHETEKAIAAALHRGECFAGVADVRARSRFAPAAPFAALGRRVCSARPGAEPLVLTSVGDRLALAPLAYADAVAVRIEHGTGVILRAWPFAVAYVAHEIHVARDGVELADQTDVVAVADASGAHTLALAVVEGRVRAMFDGVLGGDLGPGSLGGEVAVIEMDRSPKAVGPVTWSERPAVDRPRVLELR